MTPDTAITKTPKVAWFHRGNMLSYCFSEHDNASPMKTSSPDFVHAILFLVACCVAGYGTNQWLAGHGSSGLIAFGIVVTFGASVLIFQAVERRLEREAVRQDLQNVFSIR